MRSPRRRRFFVGFILGAVIVALVVFRSGWLPPAVIVVLFPTILLTVFSPATNAGFALLVVAVCIGNALLYGIVASLPPRFIVFSLVVLAALCWLILPPSNARFETQFVQHRSQMEEMVGMLNQDSNLIGITPAKITTHSTNEDSTEWKTFSVSDQQSVIPESHWNRYRQLFKQSGTSGLYRDPSTGEIVILAYRFSPAELFRERFGDKGRIHFSAADQLGIHIAFVYCPPNTEIYACRTDKAYGNATAQGDPLTRLEGSWSIVRTYVRNGLTN